MNSPYENHVLAKQNCSSRQSRCVATSNRHMHYLSPFVTCYKCFIKHWDYRNFLPRLRMQNNVVTKLP